MHGTASWSLQDHRWSDQGLWYSQSGWTLKSHGNIRLPNQVPRNCPLVPWWHDGRCPGQRWILWILPTDQRSQAGLCPGPKAAQWRFQPCCLTPLETVRLALASDTVPTESYSTPGGCKLSPRWGRLFSGTFCLLMTAPETSKRCKRGQIFLSLQ